MQEEERVYQLDEKMPGNYDINKAAKLEASAKAAREKMGLSPKESSLPKHKLVPKDKVPPPVPLEALVSKMPRPESQDKAA